MGLVGFGVVAARPISNSVVVVATRLPFARPFAESMKLVLGGFREEELRRGDFAQ